MFEIDKKRIEACMEHNDYYSALEYAIFVKDNYIKEERNFFEHTIRNIKSGRY